VEFPKEGNYLLKQNLPNELGSSPIKINNIPIEIIDIEQKERHQRYGFTYYQFSEFELRGNAICGNPCSRFKPVTDFSFIFFNSTYLYSSVTTQKRVERLISSIRA
jgi:hypothetical protein